MREIFTSGEKFQSLRWIVGKRLGGLKYEYQSDAQVLALR
jgi:hypothetical protein